MDASVFSPSQNYVDTMQPDASPVALRFLLRATGHDGPEPDTPCRYVDIGCGTGFGLNLLAATNPSATFVGIDLSPGHIARARSLAASARIENASFVEASFAEAMAQPQAGSADIVACHGILSWVEPDDLDRALDLAQKLLAPMGLLYCGYNSMPGWSAIEPLRAMIRTLAAEGDPDDAATAIATGFSLLRTLADVDGSAVSGNAQLLDWLERFDDAPDAYLVHEYLAGSGRAFWHGEIAGLLERRGLAWLCSAEIADGLDALRLPERVSAALAGVGGGVPRRHLRDIALNRSFATDVFTAGRRKAGTGEAAAALDRVPVVSHCPPGLLAARDAPSGLRREMIACAMDGPVAFGRIAELAGSAKKGRGAVLNLLADGLLRVACGEVAEATRETAARFNETVLAESSDCPNLACPEVGGGLILTAPIRAILADPGHGDRAWLRAKVPGL